MATAPSPSASSGSSSASASIATALLAHAASRRGSVQAPTGGRMGRRKTFLMELQDQMQQHIDTEQDRERQKEVLTLHRILQKPPETRDATDIDILYEWVMKNGSTNKIFQGAQEIICKTICREMTLLELPEKGVVCYQGDYGDIFFIIISGSVSLFVDSKRRPQQLNSRNSISTTGHGSRPNPYLHHTAAIDFGDSDRDTLGIQPDQYGSFIKQIFAGGTFGELAVMDPTARRSCTIVCDVPTSFICLKRAAYQRLIRITNSSHLDFTQIEFLETLFFFEGWPHGELTRLSNRLRHLNFPADTFLTRVGSEANMVYFIYAGIVQETIPLIHYLNENGSVYKCSTVENDSSKRSLQERTRSDQQQKRRICLELNLYQDHDICGEFPIVFNKSMCNTDLLAVTDVKTLIMDRETWKELFFMHGLDHIRESHRRFRSLAEARENWRQTRIKLALSNPGLVLTISTKAMMQDGKCICGWCGSKEHITGDPSCAQLIASKKRQADKQKKNGGGKKNRKAQEMGQKAQAIKNTINFVNTLVETSGFVQRKASAIAMGLQATELEDRLQFVTINDVAAAAVSPPSATKRLTIKLVAQKILETKHAHAHEETAPEDSLPITPDALEETLPPTKAPAASPRAVVHVPHPPPPRRHALTQESPSMKATLQFMTPDDPMEKEALPPLKIDDVRKSAFSDSVVTQYKQELVRKIKRVTDAPTYYATRHQVLEAMHDQDNQADRPTRKPKIPKPNRRLCGKNHREPRPDRFNRKINRMLKKIRAKDHKLPVVEESLRDL